MLPLPTAYTLCTIKTSISVSTLCLHSLLLQMHIIDAHLSSYLVGFLFYIHALKAEKILLISGVHIRSFITRTPISAETLLSVTLVIWHWQ